MLATLLQDITSANITRPIHKEEKFEEEILEEDEAEVNLSKLDEEILEVSNVANNLTIIILYGGCVIHQVGGFKKIMATANSSCKGSKSFN